MGPRESCGMPPVSGARRFFMLIKKRATGWWQGGDGIDDAGVLVS